MTASWLGAVLASNVFRWAAGPWSRKDSCFTVDRPVDLLERMDRYLFHFRCDNRQPRTHYAVMFASRPKPVRLLS